MSTQIETARAYLSALEKAVPRDDLAAFFTDDVIQHEFPNRLTPNGATRNLDTILDGHERGKQVVQAQKYEVLNIIEAGHTVILEVNWSARLNIPIGDLAAGDDMRARFAVFLEFREGKIAAQRNYDCFTPF